MKTVFKNPWVRFIGLLILVYLGVRVLYVIRGVLIPFSLALIAAYIFDPVVDWLETKRVAGRKLNRGVSVGLLVGVFAALIAAFIFFAIPSAVNKTADLLTAESFDNVVQYLPEGTRKLVQTIREAEPAERQKIITGLIGDLFEKEGAADAVGESARAIAVSTFTAIMWIFQFFLFFVVTIYLLLDIDRIRELVKGALPLRYKDEILRISSCLDVNLKAFFRGQVVVVAALACIFTIGLGIVGCPFWYIVGIAGGLGAFVPYFALASGMVPAIVLSVAEHGDIWHPVAAAGVFAFGMAVDNILITPKVIGKSVGMHPVLIILSILVFGTLFGFLGVIFAVPIAAVVKVFTQELFAKYKSSGLYTGQGEGVASQ